MAGEAHGREFVSADPSSLTTQNLQHEIKLLKELIDSRLNAMDKAVVILQDITNRSPTINEVFLQHEERFRAIAQQFIERDTRSEQTAKDSKVAVDAALSAQKEAAAAQNQSNAAAIVKSEVAFTKQMDQQGTLINTVSRTLDEKVDDLKQRMAASDGRKSGIGDGWGFLIGGAGVLIAIAALIMSLVRSEKSPEQSKEPAPQIIYLPPPAPTPAKTQ